MTRPTSAVANEPAYATIHHMNIDKDTIEHLAELSKLELTEDEKAKYQKQLGDIFGMIERLQNADLEDVKPTTQVTDVKNVTREDKVNYNFERNDITASMPDVDEEGQLVVKAVFTGDSPSH